MASDPSFEQLGLFYLGKPYDLAARTRLDAPVLYDSRDLVTHAVCVGMTGSGKTGLGIGVIEEAAIDGIPVIAIDPKGDLGNLLLDPTGPDAERWRAGLAEWGQDEARRERMRATAEFRVLTPGSRAGLPLAILRSLAPPPGSDAEATASRAAAVASSLLALAGLDATAPHDREQVFMATLLSRAWEAGITPDLATIVQHVLRPGIDRVGVLDLETFYPAAERQPLALRLNAVLAAPGFDVWLAGEPLDAASLLYSPSGKPRVSIVSIAHLSDAERMLVVSLVLQAVLEWTRRQSGTSSLRALVYMDEVFGYLPPTANPASKAPLLTLLKQARAFGVGVMLSTQNPVDLDYKALSNTGTWFLGKLQTERDKARVLDGLEGAAPGVDRDALDRALSALPGRVFLMHNVHEKGPVTFETRWVLSHLKGPMTLEEIRALQAPNPDSQIPGPKSHAPGTGSRPVLPAGIAEYFLPGAAGALEPVLYGAARVHYSDARRRVDLVTDVRACAPLVAGPVAVDWEHAEDSEVAPGDLAKAAPAGATFAGVPAAAFDTKQYAEWGRDFTQWVTRARPLKLFSTPAMKLTSLPGESERDFLARLQQLRREQRDAAVDALRKKYQARLERLENQVERAQEATAREQQQASQQKTQTAVSLGATLLGALLGRKLVSASTLGRATTAARGVSRASKEAADVARAEARAADAERALDDAREDVEEDVRRLTAEFEASPAIETIEIAPRRGAIDVQLVALAWREATTRTPRP